MLSYMNFVMGPHCSGLTAENTVACVQLKVANYKPNIKALEEEKHGHGSH